MSTRATYTFIRGEYDGPVSAYIHYDGYPAGAARYFHNMVKASPLGAEQRKYTHTIGRAALESLFIAGNVEHARITDDPAAHSDREYHYEVNTQALTVTGYKCSSRGTVAFCQDLPLDEFINGYMLRGFKDYISYLMRQEDQRPGSQVQAAQRLIDQIEHFRPVVLVSMQYSRELWTTAQLRKLSDWFHKESERYDDDNPNKQGCLNKSTQYGHELTNIARWYDAKVIGLLDQLRRVRGEHA